MGHLKLLTSDILTPYTSFLSVCILPVPAANAARVTVYPEYIHEILGHAGIGCSTVSLEELPGKLSQIKLLLTVGEARLPQEAQQELRKWVEAGGAWLSIAGICGMPALFGAVPEPPAFSGWGGGLSSLGEGYLATVEDTSGGRSKHPALAHLEIPLHYFNGLPVLPAGAAVLAWCLDAHQRPTPRAAVLHSTVGKGHTLLVAPDLTGTVVRIQQGVAVTRDGVPAPDGSAPIADGVLKSDDGAVLDWIFDRQPVKGVNGFYAFLQPVADQWRELLIRAIFFLAQESNITLPVLWLYPRNLPALAHLSHDTDGNETGKGERLLDLLDRLQVRSTWCVILPGYPAEMTARIREAGHELAMHFDAMTHTSDWNEAALDHQWRQLVHLLSGQAPVTNKNHYLRWQGDTEFFEWLARHGIELDQSKGASKTGEAGFNFGACHLYFPVAPDGAILDVLEMPTPTQDLVVFAPEALLDPLLDAVEKCYGVMHLLFHPAHIEKPGVAEALTHAIGEVRRRGLEWWTAGQINSWERARRKALWIQDEQQDGEKKDEEKKEGECSASLSLGETLPGATILLPASRIESMIQPIQVNGVNTSWEWVERWGFKFRAVALDLDGGTKYTISWGQV